MEHSGECGHCGSPVRPGFMTCSSCGATFRRGYGYFQAAFLITVGYPVLAAILSIGAMLIGTWIGLLNSKMGPSQWVPIAVALFCAIWLLCAVMTLRGTRRAWFRRRDG